MNRRWSNHRAYYGWEGKSALSHRLLIACHIILARLKIEITDAPYRAHGDAIYLATTFERAKKKLCFIYSC